jgi:hypothetical protein
VTECYRFGLINSRAIYDICQAKVSLVHRRECEVGSLAPIPKTPAGAIGISM